MQIVRGERSTHSGEESLRVGPTRSTQRQMAPSPRPQKLDEAAIQAFLSSKPDWTHDTTTATIARTFSFGSYAAGIAFVVRAGFWAEKLDHHPDLVVGYKRVTASMTTHDAGGITALDLELAKKLDEVAAGS